MRGTKRAALFAGIAGLTALGVLLYSTSRPRGPRLAPERSGVEQHHAVHDPAAPAELSAAAPFEAGAPRISASEPIDESDASGPSPPEPPWRFEVEGRVVDSQARAVAGAELRTHARSLATSDGDGTLRAPVELARDAEGVYQSFSFDGGLPTAVMLVAAEGYRTAVLEVRIVQSGTAHLGTIVLAPGGDVAGVVLDETGAPFAGARVDWLAARELPAEEAAQAWLREYGPQGDGIRAPAFVTGADGRFVLAGLPLAEVFLVAGASGHDFVWSEPFTLTAVEIAPRTLVLGPRRTALVRVAGRVVDAGGAPLAGCEVRVDDVGPQGEGLQEGLEALGYLGYAGGPYTYFGTLAEVRTDAEGRFAAEFERREPASVRVSLLVRDPELRGYPATLEDVAPADGPFEIVLAAPRRLVLRVVDPLGAPVVRPGVVFSGADDDLALVHELQGLGADGTGEFLRPLAPFHVEVSCAGFRSETLGPFEPATLGPELRLVLQPGQAVQGRVTAAGRGLGGVRLGLHAVPEASVARSTTLAPLDRPFTARGALALGRIDATTDGEGSFVLTLHEDGVHVITAEAEGHPWTAFGPFAWQRATGVVGLELELLPAGAIEGRVLVPPGRSPEGRLVGVASGWNVAFTTSAGPDGRYRIEGLAPGRYQVRPCVPPATSRESFGVRVDEREHELVFDCQVFPGQVTRHDLDLRDEEDFVLRGSFRFQGDESWSVTLTAPGADGDGLRLAETRTSPEDTFEFRLAQGGDVVLQFVGATSGSPSFTVPLRLEPGVTEWHSAPPAGSVRVRELDARALQMSWLTLRWHDATGLQFKRFHYCWDAQSGVAPEPFVVPAGRVELWGHGPRNEKTLLAELDVSAGVETEYVSERSR